VCAYHNDPKEILLVIVVKNWLFF